MIIGVDAGMLSAGDEQLKTGVYRVAVNLLRALGRIDTTNTYRLYSFSPIEKEILQSFGHRMENLVLTPRQGWFTVRLPLELGMHPVDVFLGLAQALPAGQARMIGFIYDLGFIHFPNVYLSFQNRLTRQTNALVARADHIVTISKSAARDIAQEFAIASEKISVMRLASESRFSPNGEKMKRENPYFLFVGVLKRGKNIPLLIKSFALFLTRQKKPYDLLIIGGESWLDSDIDITIRQLHLENRVQRLGFVADEKLSAYYRGAVAFVSPSLVEGFCLPAVEAMASGCPVIVSDIPVMKEIMGNAGIFVDPTDPHALADALKSVINPSYRRALRLESVSRAKAFSWKHAAQIVQSLL